ncbi:MAG: hypothetical protein ACJ790_16890 [Myxococcaceae bacterium]
MKDDLHDVLIELEDRVHRERAELEIAEEVPSLRDQVSALEKQIAVLSTELSDLGLRKSMSEVTNRLDARKRRLKLLSAWCLTAMLAAVWAMAHLASFTSDPFDGPRAHGDIQHWPVPFDRLRAAIVPPARDPMPSRERAKLEANF